MYKLCWFSNLESDVPEIGVNVYCPSTCWYAKKIVVILRNMEDIRDAYYDPEHPAGFASIQKLVKTTGVSERK